MTTLFCVKRRHGRHLQITTSYEQSQTPSIDVYLLEEQLFELLEEKLHPDPI